MSVSGPAWAERPRSVAYVGGLSEQQGVDVLLGAAAVLGRDGVTVDIVGDGPANRAVVAGVAKPARCALSRHSGRHRRVGRRAAAGPGGMGALCPWVSHARVQRSAEDLGLPGGRDARGEHAAAER